MSLTVRNLKILSENGIPLVRDVSFSVNPGEITCLVGESGSGKTLTSLAILGLLPGRMKVEGEVKLDGLDLTDENVQKKTRWKQISVVFQDPASSLNPLLKIKTQIEEVLKVHKCSENTYEKVIELLRRVHIKNPEDTANLYPHHLSGGMKQRVAIAMAVACKPKYLIADEPTTALDVSIQKKILDLFKETAQAGTGVLFITHDLSVVKDIAQKICVVYAGYTFEFGDAKKVLKNPLHPYTAGLIKVSPRIQTLGKRKLPFIPGYLPEANKIPPGCPFHPRCECAMDVCKKSLPPMREKDGRLVRCHLL